MCSDTDQHINTDQYSVTKNILFQHSQKAPFHTFHLQGSRTPSLCTSPIESVVDGVAWDNARDSGIKSGHAHWDRPLCN